MALVCSATKKILDFPLLLFDDTGLFLLPDDLVIVHLCDNPVTVLLSDGLVIVLLCEDSVLVLLPDDLVTTLLSHDLSLSLVSYNSTLFLLSEYSVFVFHRYKEQVTIFTFLLETKRLLWSQFLVLLLHDCLFKCFPITVTDILTYILPPSSNCRNTAANILQHAVTLVTSSLSSLRILQLFCLFWGYMCRHA
jgi:hypothetical protein